jgi:hypothetical protein
MKTDISFCPVCAGKLEAADDEQFTCEDCESKFFIQLVVGDDDDEDEDEDEDEEDEDDEEEVEEKDDEY